MSLESLEALLRPEAEEVEVGGNLPFRLAPAEAAWFLAAGKVEVFAVRLGEDGSEGPRTHLLSARAGQMIFGTRPGTVGGAGGAGDKGMALLAVGLPGTRLLKVAVPRLRQIARDAAASADLAGLIEGWIQGLAGEIPRASPPQVFVELKPGAEARIETPGTAARANQGVVWVRHVRGQSAFLGAPELALTPEEYLLPLAERTWLVSASPLELSAVDTRILLRGGGLWEGLAHYHELFLRLVAREISHLVEEERSRLGRKHTRDRSVVAAAHGQLAAVLGEVLHTPLPPEEQEEPLLLACRLVGRAQGLDLRPPVESNAGRGRLLDRICTASRVRARRVILREDWWRRDNGPLLAFRLLDEKGESRRAVALLPTSRTSYEMVDPVEPSETARRPVDAGLAERLAGEAYMFYLPFPERPLDLWDLLRMTFRNRQDDLLTLLLMGIAGGSLGLLVPLATGAIFGSIIPSSNRGQLLEMSLALGVSAFAAAAFQVTRSIAVLRLGGKFDGTVQAAVWDRLLALPVAFFRRFTVGDLASRSMGIDAIRELLTGNVLTALLSAVFSVFSFALLFYYSRPLALVATGLVAVLLAVTAALVWLQLRKQRQLLHLEGRIASLLFGLINAVGKLRVAGAERRAYALWAGRFAEQRRRAIEAQRFANVQAAFNAVYGVLTLAALFAMAGLSTLSTGAGLSTSDFLAFNAAFGQFQAAALSIIGLLSTVLTMVPIYERLSPILRTPPEVDATKAQAGELKGDVEMSHLSFRYKEDGPLILDDVSFRARPGEFIALVGPSGSGKSTCLRLLLGFEQPAAGSIYFDGQDLPSLDVHSVRRQIGVVLQNGRPMVGSLYSNIVGEGDLGIDAAWEAARMAGLEEDIRAMPMGMHTVVSEGAGTFSGGQRQRLLIARALVHRPRILLFDEATSALDNRTQEIVSQSLTHLKATRIVVAHRLSTILHADRIYVLRAGRVVEEGTYEELVGQGGLFARLVERQTA